MLNRKTCKVLKVPSATVIYLWPFLFVYHYILPKNSSYCSFFFFNNLVSFRFPCDGSTKLNTAIEKYTAALKICLIKSSKVSTSFLQMLGSKTGIRCMFACFLNWGWSTKNKLFGKCCPFKRTVCLSVQWGETPARYSHCPALVLKADQQSLCKTDFSAHWTFWTFVLCLLVGHQEKWYF